MRAIAAVFVLAALGAGEAHAQTLLWSGDDNGYARQIALAASDTHVSLPEAYWLTTLEIATGAVTTTDIGPDGAYLPVEASVVENGTLYLAMGYVESGTDPIIASFRPGDAALTVLATLS